MTVRVFVECYADAALVRTLGVERGRIRHERSKGNVVNRVEESEQAIGLIDEDPASAQPRALAAYEVFAQGEGLKLLASRARGQKRIIVIQPRLEDWILERAAVSGLRPSKYGLPGGPQELHRIPRYDLKEGYTRLLRDLCEKDAGVRRLAKWISD
ncbi:MAG: hypothetical protein FJ279_10650 [Planctomycetes bacterium]|nr:hypothetical protein [Planctomycetota bacterium]